MKHTIFIVVFCLLLPVAPSVADYPGDEKPVWGLTADTALTLKAKQPNTSILGWITYGLNDRFQIPTWMFVPVVDVSWRLQ